MTLWQKFNLAVRYLLQRNMVVYWLGSALLLCALEWLFFRDALLQTFNSAPIEQAQTMQAQMDMLMQAMAQIPPGLVILSWLASFIVTARALDAAKCISNGDTRCDTLAPVSRIGWPAVVRYFAGSIAIVVMLTLLFTLLGGLLLTLLGKAGLAIVSILLLFGFLFASYVFYAATLVFIETLSFTKMVNPRHWRREVQHIGYAQLCKIMLLLFAVAIVFNLVGSVFAGIPLLNVFLTTVAGQFLTMLNFVWLGYFAGSHQSATDSEHSARLLYGADTAGMSDADKQAFVRDLAQADEHYAAGRRDQAIATLQPYTRHHANATRYFPAYQRLYQWSMQDSAAEGAVTALRAQIIRIAAQGHERFYQLIDDALLDIAQTQNSQIAANDVLPLARLALAHRQPDTVLALAKDFGKRQSDHPDVVKVYGCVIEALVQQGHHDVAQQMVQQMQTQYGDHRDIGDIRDLAARLGLQ